jgi:DNA-binding MarR family transcriptional regulator
VTGRPSEGDDSIPPNDASVGGAALLGVVRAIGSATDAYRRAVAAAVGLGTADLVALSLLHREQPQQAGQIGEWAGLTPGSVTALLNRLEARGYVTRIRPTHNRRSLQVRLTPAGRALGDAVINGLLPTMDRIADELGPTACRNALSAFQKINTALDDLAADPRLNLPATAADPVESAPPHPA